MMNTFRDMARQVDAHYESNFSAQEVKKKSEGLNFSPEEFCRLQQMKSDAAANGEMDLEAAQEVYVILGESCEGFNKRASLGLKYVMTAIFKKLLEARLAGV